MGGFFPFPGFESGSGKDWDAGAGMGADTRLIEGVSMRRG